MSAISYFNCRSPQVMVELTDIVGAVVDGDILLAEDAQGNDLSHWWGLLNPVIAAAIRRRDPEWVFGRIGEMDEPQDGFALQSDGTILWRKTLTQTRLWSIAYDLMWWLDIPFDVVFETRQGGQLGTFSSKRPEGDKLRRWVPGRTPTVVQNAR